jgi:hypothetical protein
LGIENTSNEWRPQRRSIRANAASLTQYSARAIADVRLSKSLRLFSARGNQMATSSMFCASARSRILMM